MRKELGFHTTCRQKTKKQAVLCRCTEERIASSRITNRIVQQARWEGAFRQQNAPRRKAWHDGTRSFATTSHPFPCSFQHAPHVGAALASTTTPSILYTFYYHLSYIGIYPTLSLRLLHFAKSTGTRTALYTIRRTKDSYFRYVADTFSFTPCTPSLALLEENDILSR